MKAPQITIFTTMKPFRGEFIRIQRNAIRSWLALEPTPEILVFGNDEGVAEVCSAFDLRHIPDTCTAPSGAPYLDDLFAKAQKLASRDLLCYINADIILLPHFMSVVGTVYSRFGQAIIACVPVNARIDFDLDTTSPLWEDQVRKEINRRSISPVGADIFLFPRSFTWNPPKVVVGRWWWDCALLWRACTAQIPAIDVSATLVAIHQDHSYTTHPGSQNRITQTYDSKIQKEIQSNFRAIRWWERTTWRIDIPYELTEDGHIIRRFLFPRCHLFGAIVFRKVNHTKQWVLERTFRLRRYFRLYQWWA
jgi:hypothetical protein